MKGHWTAMGEYVQPALSQAQAALYSLTNQWVACPRCGGIDWRELGAQPAYPYKIDYECVGCLRVNWYFAERARWRTQRGLRLGPMPVPDR